MLRPSALKAASGGEEIGRGIGYGSPGSVQPIPSRWVTGRKLAARAVYIIFSSLWWLLELSDVSQTPLVSRYRAHTCANTTCAVGAFALRGRSGGAAAPADRSKAHRAGHALFPESCAGAVRGWEEPCWPDRRLVRMGWFRALWVEAPKRLKHIPADCKGWCQPRAELLYRQTLRHGVIFV